MEIILGSSSPRRKTILGQLTAPFRIVPPEIDESIRSGESPEVFAVRIAEEKSRAILRSGAADSRPALVITADTIVTIDGRIIGKPSGFEEAAGMIADLSGRTHRVITGLSLLATRSAGAHPELLTAHEITEVTFKALDRDGIVRYLSSIDYRDKAGSYAFQEQGGMIIAGYRGSATNIIGFPLRLFFSMAADMGLVEELFGKLKGD